MPVDKAFPVNVESVPQGNASECPLHHFRSADSQPCQRANQLPLRDRGRCQQKLLPLRIRFGQNVMLAIEIAELLRELKRMLRQIGRLSRGNALIEQQSRLCRPQPDLPDAVSIFARKIRRQHRRPQNQPAPAPP